jgi:RHS repeat-associated protein
VDDTGTTPITTTYTNDIMGLSQVLVADDGSSQTHLLFGLDLISQDDGNATRYLLADGLGSVRVEMVDDAVATAITYEPFGKVLQQAGSSDTVYGFTGEQYDTSTNQLYLRARYYDPALHTFMSQDPWSGNGGRPQSMNGWSYVNNSPVNLADPTGMKPFPDDCRSAGPTAVEYGNCVRKYYGVEPPNEQGFTDIVLHFQMVQGVQGCWEGPVPYRAGGYFEGVTFTLAAVVAAFGGGEVVYDFAAMQRQSYVYDGSGIVNMLGFSLSAYFGSLEGMRSYRSIELDYSGDFEGYFLGGGPRFPNLPKPPIGPILTTGKLNFAGVPDNSVSGEAWYVTTGIGAGIPYIDPGKILKTSYVPATSITRYAPSGPGPRTVTREYLIEDIINGTGSPISHERNRTTSHFPMASDYIKTGLWTFLQLKRSSGISDAVNYADIFDGIHNDSFLTSSPYSR